MIRAKFKSTYRLHLILITVGVIWPIVGLIALLELGDLSIGTDKLFGPLLESFFGFPLLLFYYGAFLLGPNNRSLFIPGSIMSGIITTYLIYLFVRGLSFLSLKLKMRK